MMRENLEVAENAKAAANAAAAWILNELRDLVLSGVAKVAISGGSTPKLMFETLARTPFPWNKVHVFWVDERCVAPNDPQSNYGVAAQIWLNPAQIPAENVHRIKGELDPKESAAEYVKEIQKAFAIEGGEIPAFDIVHRGMGDDAHTASLFPGEPLINDRTGIAAAVYVEKVNMHRVTLLPAVLLAARKTVMLVAGEDKAEPLLQVLRGPDDSMRFPCQIATRDAVNTIWFVDRAAVARL